jgi:hypothetical protein
LGGGAPAVQAPYRDEHASRLSLGGFRWPFASLMSKGELAAATNARVRCSPDAAGTTTCDVVIAELCSSPIPIQGG